MRCTSSTHNADANHTKQPKLQTQPKQARNSGKQHNNSSDNDWSSAMPCFGEDLFDIGINLQKKMSPHQLAAVLKRCRNVGVNHVMFTGRGLPICPLE